MMHDDTDTNNPDIPDDLSDMPDEPGPSEDLLHNGDRTLLVARLDADDASIVGAIRLSGIVFRSFENACPTNARAMAHILLDLADKAEAMGMQCGPEDAHINIGGHHE